jgi:DNA-directed RNA polymerase III subunit RPC8
LKPYSTVSLGFFDDINIPAGLIQKPSRHVPDPENR